MTNAQVEEAKEVVEEAEVAVQESGDTLLAALVTVERALEESRTCLQTAMHKAKDAETVIKLLRGQLSSLRSKLDQASH